MRNKILWSDETVWRKPGTITMVKHGGGSILLWGCFPVAGRLVRIEGNINGAKYREILDENLLQSTKALDWGEGSPSNRPTTPKHAAKTMQEWLWDKSQCP